MADTTITALPNAAALTGAERVPMDQSGTTVDASTQAIAALATKATVGLGNVDNTSDANKPISAAAQTALDGKASTGAIGSSGITMTAGILGRESGTGAPQVFTLGSGLSIVNGALTATGGGGGGGGSGTVTSVALSVPLGFAVTGGPITSSGTLALAYAAGYSLPLTSSQASWDAAAALAATAVQPAALTGYVQTSDSRLSDSREWSATTISQAEAEAGTSTSRRAFTAQRVFQAAAAWWAGYASAVGQAVATAASQAAGRTALGLGSASTAATSDFATAAQGAKADTAIQPGNAALTDSREWSADTISQAEAEAGTATTRRAFTALRVFQAVAAWWAASAAATKLAGIATGATANATDAQLRDRSTHTGTQPASTITGLATVATSGAYGDLSGRPTLFDPASPGAIGGTTPGAGSFTSLTASTRLGLPSGAPASPAARDLYAVSNTLRYRDSSNTERLLLNAADNLSNVGSASTSLANLGGMPLTFNHAVGSVTGTVTLDLASVNGYYASFTLTGNITFATANLALGRQMTIRIICDATQRTLTFPAGWTFIGTKPSTIAASKTAVLSLTFFGSTDADCVAAYGVQS